MDCKLVTGQHARISHCLEVLIRHTGEDRGNQCLGPMPVRYGGRLGWRLLHQHEARPFQVADQTLGSDPGHELIPGVDTLPAVEAEREGNYTRHQPSRR